MEVLLRNGARWVRREVHASSDDSLLLYLQESRGGENLEELMSVAILNLGLGGQPVVRATVMEYFPEAYIGGEIRYDPTGEPESAGLTVELDYDPAQFKLPSKRVSRNYRGSNKDVFEFLVGDGDRDRIRFPESWTEQADQAVFEVGVRTKHGEWMCRNLTFPARMTVEMLKNSGRKKLT